MNVVARLARRNVTTNQKDPWLPGRTGNCKWLCTPEVRFRSELFLWNACKSTKRSNETRSFRFPHESRELHPKTRAPIEPLNIYPEAAKRQLFDSSGSLLKRKALAVCFPIANQISLLLMWRCSFINSSDLGNYRASTNRYWLPLSCRMKRFSQVQ